MLGTMSGLPLQYFQPTYRAWLVHRILSKCVRCWRLQTQKLIPSETIIPIRLFQELKGLKHWNHSRLPLLMAGGFHCFPIAHLVSESRHQTEQREKVAHTEAGKERQTDGTSHKRKLEIACWDTVAPNENLNRMFGRTFQAIQTVTNQTELMECNIKYVCWLASVPLRDLIIIILVNSLMAHVFKLYMVVLHPAPLCGLERSKETLSLEVYKQLSFLQYSCFVTLGR